MKASHVPLNESTTGGGIEQLEGLWDYFVRTHPGTIQLDGDTAVGGPYVAGVRARARRHLAGAWVPVLRSRQKTSIGCRPRKATSASATPAGFSSCSRCVAPDRRNPSAFGNQSSSSR